MDGRISFSAKHVLGLVMSDVLYHEERAVVTKEEQLAQGSEYFQTISSQGLHIFLAQVTLVFSQQNTGTVQ
ncbi:hypothetical protein CHS0354_031267 [Potamilus streckersoni]|uniref:Uncharacterized protein n=1 Tax=Potamilus streckersoni TaxID=2493646 RepID=A0AAE0SBL8_9BIVA|nr:hypothetical protein CHS0354_031267 [Potamilus streckersoni]